ncbi:hypothetical protein C2G38_2233625 [Gigaspora rosea]|uniref:Uncharacterized protein n=1 Tax=Gigaspora rosea TaxID=44941 RepID=A0A397TUP6_9GLOM|nr:hypothetical protein C2G38_2233625 [Gigaspora rosea]
MPIHTSMVVFISAKNNNNSFAHGIAQYQPSKNTYATINWKHFDPPSNFNDDFSVGNIVSIAGKFAIENSEQYVTIASATVVDKKDSKDEFDEQSIPLNAPHLMFNAIETCDLKTLGETVYFGVETRKYNFCTGSQNEKDHTTNELHQDIDKKERKQKQESETDYDPGKEIKIDEQIQNEKRKGKRKLSQHDSHDEFNQESDIDYNSKEKPNAKKNEVKSEKKEQIEKENKKFRPEYKNGVK